MNWIELYLKWITTKTNFNKNSNKSLNLAYVCQNYIAIIRNGISVISFKKDKFKERVFSSMLVCRKQVMSLDEFCRMSEYLLAEKSVDVIAGDFYCHHLKIYVSKLLGQMIGYKW